MRIIAIIFILLLYTLSCKDHTNQDIKVIDVGKYFKQHKEIMLSEIGSDVEYIQLESLDTCFIGRIEKILFIGDKIAILDYRSNNVLLFNRNGKYLRHIGKIGQGPGEFIRVSDITFLPEDSSICLIDELSTKFLRYNLNGKLIFEKHFSMNPDKTSILNDSLMVFRVNFPEFVNNENYCVSVCDKNLNEISKLMDHSYLGISFSEAYHSATHSRALLDIVQDTLTTWECGYDTIYKILGPNEIIPKYYLDYPSKKPMNPQYINKIVPNMNAVERVIETKNYFFFSGGIGGKFFRMIYFKEINNGYVLQSSYSIDYKEYFTNDLDGGYPFFPEGITRDGKVYSTFSLFSLKKLLLEKSFSDINPVSNGKRDELLRLVDNSQLEDNQCIMLVTLK